MSDSESDSNSNSDSENEDVIHADKKYDHIFQQIIQNKDKITTLLHDSVMEWDKDSTLSHPTIAPIEANYFIVVYVKERHYEKLFISDHRSICNLWTNFYNNKCAGFVLGSRQCGINKDDKDDKNDDPFSNKWTLELDKNIFNCSTYSYENILTYWSI